MITIAARAILISNFWQELLGLQIELVPFIFGGFLSAIGVYFWRLGPHARMTGALFIILAATLTPVCVWRAT